MCSDFRHQSCLQMEETFAAPQPSATELWQRIDEALARPFQPRTIERTFSVSSDRRNAAAYQPSSRELSKWLAQIATLPSPTGSSEPRRHSRLLSAISAVETSGRFSRAIFRECIQLKCHRVPLSLAWALSTRGILSFELFLSCLVDSPHSVSYTHLTLPTKA